MTLLGLVIFLIVVGIVLTLIPMDPDIKRIIVIVVAVVVVLALLAYFGVLGSHYRMRIA